MCHPIVINLAVEDALSEQMLRALLDQCGREYEVGAVYRKNGSGYLRTKLAGFNNAAKGSPFLMLTDLDERPCATDLIQEWFACGIKDYWKKRNHNLVFLIAIREVETWLMADRESFANFLNIKVDQIPFSLDRIIDPKRHLLDLVGRTKNRRIREDILPRTGSTIQIGPDYNGRLAEFIKNHWRLDEAEKNSTSLHRARIKLLAFAPKL